MTLSKKQLTFLTLLLAAAFLSCLLLLTGCGDKEEAPVTDGNAAAFATEGDISVAANGEEIRYDEQGNWTTDGNVWFASSGDVWSTDGNAWYSLQYDRPRDVNGVIYAVHTYQ